MSAKNSSMRSALLDVEILPIIRDIQEATVRIPDGRTVFLIAKSEEQLLRLYHDRREWIRKNLEKTRKEEEEAGKMRGMTLFGSEISMKDFRRAGLSELRKSFRQALKAYGAAYLGRISRNPPIIRPWRMKKVGAYSMKKDEIHLSIYAAMLPRDLIEYALYHEYCHRFVGNHGKAFWKRIAKEHPDYADKESKLRIWWMSIRKHVEKQGILSRI